VKSFGVISSALHDGPRLQPDPATRNYVFFFVPVYVEKKTVAISSPPVDLGWLAELRRIFFRRDRQSLLPFWTWFIDNPRPSIALKQRQ
jgi:hypothetical protein